MHEFRGPQIHVAVLEDHFPWSVIDHDARSYINLFGCSLSEHECSVLARLVRPPQMDARSLCHTVSPVPNVAPLTPCAPGGCAVGCSGYLALFLPDWLPHSAPPGDGDAWMQRGLLVATAHRRTDAAATPLSLRRRMTAPNAKRSASYKWMIATALPANHNQTLVVPQVRV